MVLSCTQDNKLYIYGLDNSVLLLKPTVEDKQLNGALLSDNFLLFMFLYDYQSPEVHKVSPFIIVE